MCVANECVNCIHCYCLQVELQESIVEMVSLHVALEQNQSNAFKPHKRMDKVIESSTGC